MGIGQNFQTLKVVKHMYMYQDLLPSRIINTLEIRANVDPQKYINYGLSLYRLT